MRMKRWVAGVISLAGVMAFLLLLPDEPAQPQPGSYRESVLRLLSARGLEARDVEVVDNCAPTVERCRTYAGSVTIHAGARLRGRIECRDRWTTCTLTAAEAGLDHEPLPDVIDPLAWRAQQLWYTFIGWLHRAGRS